MNFRILTLIISFCFSGPLTFGINPEYEEYMNRKYIDPAGNIKQMKFNSVSGRFNGKNSDTVTAFPLEPGELFDDDYIYSEWILVSKNGTVPSRKIKTYWPELTYEGDLDGNGCDEFGVLLTGLHGCCAGYNVMTCHNGKLVDFFDIIDLWLGNLEPLEDVATPTNKKGKVRLSYDIPTVLGAKHINKTVTVKKFLHHK